MIRFPAHYFDEEVRSGFFVSSVMKHVWAAELMMLDAFDAFAKEHGLRYYADYGTLLGAVRHGGFIPWDDDIDITMPRTDYMKLLSLADSFPEPYRILSLYHSDTFWNFHAILKNTRKTSLSWDEERRDYFQGCPFIIDLDIFPLDNIPDDAQERRTQQLLYTIAYKLTHDLIRIEEAEKRGEDVPAEMRDDLRKGTAAFCAQMKRLYGILPDINPDASARNALLRTADRIAQLCPAEKASCFDYYVHMTYPQAILREKHWYDTTVELPFETGKIPAPGAYQAVLKKRFGEQYMTMRREKGAHGYPFYAGQLEFFRYQGIPEEKLFQSKHRISPQQH